MIETFFPWNYFPTYRISDVFAFLFTLPCERRKTMALSWAGQNGLNKNRNTLMDDDDDDGEGLVSWFHRWCLPSWPATFHNDSIYFFAPSFTSPFFHHDRQMMHIDEVNQKIKFSPSVCHYNFAERDLKCMNFFFSCYFDRGPPRACQSRVPGTKKKILPHAAKTGLIFGGCVRVCECSRLLIMIEIDCSPPRISIWLRWVCG